MFHGTFRIAGAEKKPARKTVQKTAQKTGQPRKRASAPKAESRPRASAREVATSAGEQLAALVGKPVEGVTGMESTDDGWRVSIEVLELRRIPESTDMLALYEVEADAKGDLMGYRRLSRYARGTSRED
jgi:hypothetical protein